MRGPAIGPRARQPLKIKVAERAADSVCAAWGRARRGTARGRAEERRGPGYGVGTAGGHPIPIRGGLSSSIASDTGAEAMAKLLLLLLLGGACELALAAPVEDEISYLPGLAKQPAFRHYSGYLDASGSKRLHYWFVESQGNPTMDPLVVWMNGGPGCSSLEGLITENGPYLVQSDGIHLEYNPYSWNMISSVLYLEAPAGVGFSYSADKNYTTSDDEVSMDNYLALKNFFTKFPEFRKHNLYLTGESYAGFYLPTLSMRVMEDPSINLKGLAIGNGLSSIDINDNSAIYFAYYHGIFGEDLWALLQKFCCPQGKCNFSSSENKDCIDAVKKAAMHIFRGGLDPYNMYAPCADGVKPPGRNVTEVLGADPRRSFIFKKHGFYKRMMERGGLNSDSPCTNTSLMSSYLNSPAVRKALHIPAKLPPWEDCSDVVNHNFVWQYEDMRKQHLQLLGSMKYRILFYNGDVDMVCNFLGEQWFVESLQQKVAVEHRPWLYKDNGGNNQVGGFIKEFQNLVFLTVRGAGHMSPKDKPLQVFTAFSHFLRNQPF